MSIRNRNQPRRKKNANNLGEKKKMTNCNAVLYRTRRNDWRRPLRYEKRNSIINAMNRSTCHCGRKSVRRYQTLQGGETRQGRTKRIQACTIPDWNVSGYAWTSMKDDSYPQFQTLISGYTAWRSKMTVKWIRKGVKESSRRGTIRCRSILLTV